MKILGDVTCQAALFVYKDDGSENAAWNSVCGTYQQEGPVRGELHNKKPAFLDGLRTWNEGVKPTNSYLAIYAHMGKSGLGCVRNDPAREVTWQELANALPNGVAILWLIGCNSQECKTAWAPLVGPVLGHLLVTTATKYWQPFLTCFNMAISLDPIVLHADIPSEVKRSSPKLGQNTEYYRVDAQKRGFTQVP